MLGMTLQTKPEEMYRALVEATAFGTRTIIENFEKHGVPVDEFYAAGGIAEKSPFMMQVYSTSSKSRSASRAASKARHWARRFLARWR